MTSAAAGPQVPAETTPTATTAQTVLSSNWNGLRIYNLLDCYLTGVSLVHPTLKGRAGQDQVAIT